MHLNPSPSDQPTVFPLWAEGEIDTTGWNQPEESTSLPNGLKVDRNVSRPTLTAFFPDPAIATGTAVIIAPGGAWHFLAVEHEGVQVARWLNAHGIATFMLKYRVVQTGADFPACIEQNLHDPVRHATLIDPLFPLVTADGCQAVRLVRAHAAEWNLAPERIGIMGFSAGGMVTLSVALHYDATCRPSFAAPIYSAPPLKGPIPADAPPLFLLFAADDEMASTVSTRYYAEWRAAGHPVEMHVFSKGGHGFGMNPMGLPSDRWIERFAEWLQAEGFLP